MMAIIESPRLLTEISCFHVKHDEGGFPLSCGTTAVNPVTYGCHSRPTPEASNNVYIHILLCMSTLFSYVFKFEKKWCSEKTSDNRFYYIASNNVTSKKAMPHDVY